MAIRNEINLAQIADLSADTRFLGKVSASAGVAEQLTAAQATALLNTFSTSSTLKGLVPGSNGLGSTYFLNAEGNWIEPATSAIYTFQNGIGEDGGVVTLGGTITGFELSNSINQFTFDADGGGATTGQWELHTGTSGFIVDEERFLIESYNGGTNYIQLANNHVMTLETSSNMFLIAQDTISLDGDLNVEILSSSGDISLTANQAASISANTTLALNSTGITSFSASNIRLPNIGLGTTSFVVYFNDTTGQLSYGLAPDGGGGGGGALLSGSVNEIIKYASSTSGVGSKVFSASNGNLTLGDTTMGSGNRTISASNSSGVSDIILSAKSNGITTKGWVRIDGATTAGGLIIAPGTLASTPVEDAIENNGTHLFYTSSGVQRPLLSATSASTYGTITLSSTDVVTFSGTRISLTGSTNGVRLGSIASEPASGQANGDFYYNSALNKFRAYENGAWKDMITAPGSGSVPDGDKGDITVSGSGLTWTIDPLAVSYSKIQNVSNTSRFLGRITAGAGVIEELTATQATSLLNTFTSTVKGLVPFPGITNTGKYLRGDGSWQDTPDQTITLSGHITGVGTTSITTAINFTGIPTGSVLFNNSSSLGGFGNWNGSRLRIAPVYSFGNTVETVLSVEKYAVDTVSTGSGAAIDFVLETQNNNVAVTGRIIHKITAISPFDTEWNVVGINNGIQQTFLTISEKGLHMPNSAGTVTPALDTAAVYVKDIVAGNAAVHVKTENGQEIKLYQVNAGSAYTVTNSLVDRTYDANSTTMNELADVLATLIADLKLTGIIA